MAIELKKVSFTYAEHTAYASPALDGVSLRVEDGEFVGIMGKTGCGKSTLIQVLAGLLSPSSGQVLLDGADIGAKGYDRRLVRSRIGIVFQFPEIQLFDTTVEKDIAFGLRNLGRDPKTIAPAVERALSLMGFSYEQVKDKSPLGFSGGEKRKLAIAGVLACEPGILIFDEPIAGLDPAGREDFCSLVRTLHAQGRTILMISHNADILCENTTRMIAMAEGKIVRDMPTAAFFADQAYLESMGLGTSRIHKVVLDLEARGIRFPEPVLKEKELVEAVLRRWKDA